MRLGPAYSRSEISSIAAIGIDATRESFIPQQPCGDVRAVFESRKSKIGSIGVLSTTTISMVSGVLMTLGSQYDAHKWLILRPALYYVDCMPKRARL
jgi:hypothetical protein